MAKTIICLVERGPMKGRFGKDSPNYGKKFPNRAKPKTEICIYCGINTITTNIRRWHNDKCNQNKNKETKSLFIVTGKQIGRAHV